MKQPVSTTILFLPAWYPNRYDEMGGMFAKNHAIALQKDRNVHVLHVSAQRELIKTFEFVVETDVVQTYIMYYRKPKSKNFATIFIEGFLYLMATFLAYRKYRKLHARPEIYHVHVLTRAAMLPLFLSFFSKVSYVITEHWSRYFSQNNTYHGVLRKFLTHLAVKRASGLSTVSNALKQAMIKHGLNHPNFPLISNVVAPTFFEPYTKPQNPIKKFIHVSCFEERSKNIKGMIAAFEILAEKNIPFELHLIGNGMDKPTIEALVQSKGIENIYFAGELLGEELIGYYRQADALILFSNYENQPCVILEAQAVGIPVIASHVGGIPELVNEKTGILVSPGNVMELSSQLAAFINDELYFDPALIREHAQAHYSEKVVSQQIQSFYQAIKNV